MLKLCRVRWCAGFDLHMCGTAVPQRNHTVGLSLSCSVRSYLVAPQSLLHTPQRSPVPWPGAPRGLLPPKPQL